MSAAAWAGWSSTCVLIAALVRAKAGAALRAEHVARVAHELRGPLHAAGLALHAARRDAHRTVMLSAVQVELDRAAGVVADLDAPAQDRADATADLRELVGRHAGSWSALAAERGRELRIEMGDRPLVAGGGAARISQVLGNLVSNAIEHGSGRVDVRLRALGDSAVVVEVSDQGAGLPASVEVLAARPRGGRGRRGRGIAIASEIVGALGGRLTSEAARVVVELPVPAA